MCETYICQPFIAFFRKMDRIWNKLTEFLRYKAKSVRLSEQPSFREFESMRNVFMSFLIFMVIYPAHADKPVVSDAYRQGRSMAMSQHGMVATSHVLASQVGVDILRAGGTAADAAVAIAATLGVVESPSIGIGGDAWFLYYEADTKTVHAFNGSGRSPKALTREYFASKERERIVETSWESVTVPGAVDAYDQLLKRFGNMTFEEVLQPAIRYAEDGFVVHEVVGTIWFGQSSRLRQDDWSKKIWLNDGKTPTTGSVFKVPALADTLRTIAVDGRGAFYKGSIAKEIVRYAQESGGWLTEDDFASHSGEWVTPISADYRGYTVWQCPPNGQGVAVLLMLNILEGYDLGTMGYNSPEYIHHMIEAKKLAYADVKHTVGDPNLGEIPLDTLLSQEYAAKRRSLIDAGATMEVPDPGISQHSDTAYMTVVDAEGNACSFINSLFGPFGSGITGGSTGILLQNRGNGFTLEKGHFNEYAPGKRPFHTIIPGMLTKDDALYMSYGLMGGAMQPQGHVQFLSAHLDHGLNIQEAMDAPRWRHMEDKLVRLEQGSAEELTRGLEALGHEIKEGIFLLYGSAQAIRVHPETGVLQGASDPRRDGVALGW